LQALIAASLSLFFVATKIGHLEQSIPHGAIRVSILKSADSRIFKTFSPGFCSVKQNDSSASLRGKGRLNLQARKGSAIPVLFRQRFWSAAVKGLFEADAIFCHPFSLRRSG